MSALEDFNSAEQVAAYLGRKVKPATITRLRLKGAIGSTKIGNTVSYSRADVEAYVEANTVKAVLPANPWGLARP